MNFDKNPQNLIFYG